MCGLSRQVVSHGSGLSRHVSLYCICCLDQCDTLFLPQDVNHPNPCCYFFSARNISPSLLAHASILKNNNKNSHRWVYGPKVWPNDERKMSCCCKMPDRHIATLDINGKPYLETLTVALGSILSLWKGHIWYHWYSTAAYTSEKGKHIPLNINRKSHKGRHSAAYDLEWRSCVFSVLIYIPVGAYILNAAVTSSIDGYSNKFL